ncbi:MAG: hypothetical protein WAW92_02340 [Minisyncoccia bacterium]
MSIEHLRPLYSASMAEDSLLMNPELFYARQEPNGGISVVSRANNEIAFYTSQKEEVELLKEYIFKKIPES